MHSAPFIPRENEQGESKEDDTEANGPTGVLRPINHQQLLSCNISNLSKTMMVHQQRLECVRFQQYCEHALCVQELCSISFARQFLHTVMTEPAATPCVD